MLGAGTDTRAYRLSWPPGFVVYEVDTEQVTQFKNRVMQAADKQMQQQQQQHEGQAETGRQQPARRVAVVADASNARDLWSKLVSSGFDPSEPTLYLLEGFIGYLTVSAGNALLSHLYGHSAVGSHIIMTAPPSAADRARSAAVAAKNGSSNEGGSGENAGAPGIQLHHATFEEPIDTLARLCAAGWQRCELLDADQLRAKYNAEHAQALLLGKK
eukprot:GHUV01042133.1.p1 GENE.GHUV01042133.1~~GHUV01042133.1.p1  ORF type:complete len:215 (+),score=77.40 GHUV01042133.1:188-832(+)